MCFSRRITGAYFWFWVNCVAFGWDKDTNVLWTSRSRILVVLAKLLRRGWIGRMRGSPILPSSPFHHMEREEWAALGQPGCHNRKRVMSNMTWAGKQLTRSIMTPSHGQAQRWRQGAARLTASEWSRLLWDEEQSDFTIWLKSKLGRQKTDSTKSLLFHLYYF